MLQGDGGTGQLETPERGDLKLRRLQGKKKTRHERPRGSKVPLFCPGPKGGGK